MKILTNITREYLGGITRSNLNFLEFAQTHSIHVIGLELNAKRATTSPDIFNNLDRRLFTYHIVNIHDIPIVGTIKSVKGIKGLEKKYRLVIDIVKNILEKEKPDVIFLNGTYYIPWVISIAAKELAIPIVLRYAGVYSRETKNFEKPMRDIFSQIEKSFQSGVDAFIFPSELCKSVVEKEVAKTTIKNSYVIYNPVNVTTTPVLKNNNKHAIASIGRWDTIKNFEAYFEIHKILNKNKWQHSASIITGDSPTIKIPKSIDRYKPMDYIQVFAFYKKQSLILSASHFETFGNVPMEAVCAGVPVLVNNTMGCAEVLEKAGLTEMVMSYDDVKKVAQRVKEISGIKIPQEKVDLVKKILDPNTINNQIVKILKKYKK